MSTNEDTGQPTQIPLKLDDMAFEGAALGRDDDGRVVFADYGIPGEDVVVAIERQKRHFYEGQVVDVVTPADSRIEPPCPYFGRCGGCQWQHIDYQHQIELKQHVVYDQLRRIGKFEDPPISPTVPAPNPFGYRNNARFSTDNEGNLGFISRGPDGRQFMRINHCMIMHPEINEVLAKLQGRGAGLHQVIVHYGENTGDLLVHPDLTDVEPSVPSGQHHREEVLLGKRFRISDSSFFQTNTKQAEQLIEMVWERLTLTGREVVLDAYAGVGTFAVLLAPDAGRIVAIEESPSATRDAQHNIQGIPNIEYRSGKVEHVIGDLDPPPDAIILDPPRAGCHKRVISRILKFKPPKIVYVSCNPSTLARDLQLLCEGGYRLRDVTPVDMFPQTYHIESVTTLELV